MSTDASSSSGRGKPVWLKKKVNIRENEKLEKILSGLKLRTICGEALCPNITECYGRKQATFMILGRICTRNCRFCNVEKGHPETPDPAEPGRVAEASRRLNLKHVVVTSPARDDLPDGGAGVFAETIAVLKKNNNSPSVEVLIPDFRGNTGSIFKVIRAEPDIIGHNLETVRRLYRVRQGADYDMSLTVLKKINQSAPGIKTKSGIMLGLGERGREVLELMGDLLDAGVRFLSVGQYLSPGGSSLPVREFVHPERFQDYKKKALSMGFLHVESSPYTRSSYHAEDYLKK
ncbi:MAG: lipoyl synthase [bacterium]